jgi:23S rRNA (pseudouridine1915-N3)-methyltransferase
MAYYQKSSHKKTADLCTNILKKRRLCLFLIFQSMKITLLFAGATRAGWVKEGMNEYASRIRHYLPFAIVETPDVKNPSGLPGRQQELEAPMLLKYMQKPAQCYLLDEKGKQFTSESFAAFTASKMNAGVKELVLVIGGAYGFHESVRAAAAGSIALSEMTFPHQLVRVILTEQLYRALSILKNEKYHH